MAANRTSSLNDPLLCPICTYIPRAEIFSCKNSHIICKMCFDCITSTSDQPPCPVCRVSFDQPPMRNRPLEAIIAINADLRFPCCFFKRGCEFLGKRESLSGHEDACHFRPLECFLQGCQDSLALAEIVDHVKEHPGVELGSVEGRHGRLRFDVLEVFGKEDHLYLGKLANGQDFVVLCSNRAPDSSPMSVATMTVSAIVVGRRTMAQNYHCKIQVVNKFVRPRHYYKGPLNSVDSRLRPGLTLTPDAAKYLWTDGDGNDRLEVEVSVFEKQADFGKDTSSESEESSGSDDE